MTLADRFWEKVDKRGPHQCWPWLGTDSGKGYGRLRWNGTNYVATHLALEFDGRPVPPGWMACHVCDNPPCVNPAHLYPGTAADNVQDMLVRGRVNRSDESRQRKAVAARVRWAAWSEEERTQVKAKIGTSNTPAVRCGHQMAVAGEPCYRVPAHGGPHRTRASVEQRRTTRDLERCDSV